MATKKVPLQIIDPLIQDDKRKYLFVPCKTKQELKNWIRIYLDLDYPDGRVDPASNSDPMSLLWELYSAATDTDRSWERLLGFSARSCYKTLSASILELLLLVHHSRNISHMAALEAQAANSQEYIKKFLKLPIFSNFLLKDNNRELFFCRFYDPVSGMSFNEREVPLLPEGMKARLQNFTNYIKIIVATTASANGLHTNFMCIGKDQLVQTKLGNKPMSEISLSDEVAYYDFDASEIKYENPTKIVKTGQKNVYEVSIAGNGSSQLTLDHHIWSCVEPQRQLYDWATVEEANNGCIMKGTMDAVVPIPFKITGKKDLGVMDVYDMTMPSWHNFILSNDLLVKNCLDETDLISNQNAYREAKMIPSEDKGFPPMTFLTSTRKYSIGLVQKEIDEAPTTGLEIRRWSILDCTESCPKSRHRPEKPKITIYRSHKLLKAISEEDYEKLDVSTKEKYVKDEGYWGCLNNCKLFAPCRGYLINQTCKSPLLKSIQHVTQLFAANDVERAHAQLLCNKPSKEGMIYPNLDPEVHFKTPAQIARMITGEEFHDNFSQEELIVLAKGMECRFVSGMDHGYTHNFAVCTGFIYGNKLFMIDAFAVPELEISQKINLCNDRIKHFDPTIYPDPADPGARKSFIMNGFKCKEFKKGPGSVLMGIDCVRAKIQPALGREPEVYFVKDNEGVLSLFNELSKYHWIVGPDEKPTDVPSDDADDSADCFRYLIMNEFPSKKRNSNLGPNPKDTQFQPKDLPQEYTPENLISKYLVDNGITQTDPNDNTQSPSMQGNKAGIKWTI